MPKSFIRHPRSSYWTCSVRRREINRRADEKRRQDSTYRLAKNKVDRERSAKLYEEDPIWRITKLLRESRHKKKRRHARNGDDMSPVNPAVAAALDTLLERIPTYEEVRRGKVSL